MHESHYIPIHKLCRKALLRLLMIFEECRRSSQRKIAVDILIDYNCRCYTAQTKATDFKGKVAVFSSFTGLMPSSSVIAGMAFEPSIWQGGESGV